jgi:hypothetical protein
MRRMKGERVMGKRYKVGPAGHGGCSKVVVLHPDIPIAVGERVQFSDLGDGTFRFWKVVEPVVRARKRVDSRHRRGVR